MVMVGIMQNYWQITRQFKGNIINEYKSHQGINPEASCGPVCLSLTSRYLGEPIEIEECHRLVHAGELGLCSMLDIYNAAKERNIEAVPIRLNPKVPRAVQNPMILSVDGNHFLTALPFKPGSFVIIDPPDEPRIVSWKEISNSWHGEALILSKDSTSIANDLGL